jgi:hypothetical protein
MTIEQMATTEACASCRTIYQQAPLMACVAAEMENDMTPPDPHDMPELSPATLHPVNFLVSRGALSKEHAREVYRLEKIYPGGVLRRFRSKDSFRPIKDGDDAKSFVHMVRPEEMPLVYRRPLHAGETPAALVESCQGFADHVLRHDLVIPQWKVGAFWWASQSILRKLSIEQLRRHLDSWRNRFEHALVWWNMYRNHKDDSDFKALQRARLRAAFEGDLGHSGAIDFAESCDDPGSPFSDRYLEVLRKFDSGVMLPSPYQWGLPLYWDVNQSEAAVTGQFGSDEGGA